MEPCLLSYIPASLHSNEKPDIPTFELGEYLYRRCKPEDLDEPFDKISLYDLSVNRQGQKDTPLSQKEEVLFNLFPENGKGEKVDESVITLEIKELAESRTYEKILSHDGKDGNNKLITYTCFLQLLHDKLPCNYSHCIFRITFNGEVVNRDNWKQTLGKRGALVTELRNKCKIEFEQMIREKEVRINW